MGRIRYFLYAAAVIGLYFLWTLALFPFAADHTPICGACHATRGSYTTVYGSPHREIGCLACHRSPGLGGAIASDLRGWTNLTSWIMRRPSHDVRVDNDACLRCHDIVLVSVERSKSLKTSHREIVAAGWRCTDCHGATGHELSATKTALQQPSMDKCFGCHAETRFLSRCGLCHRQNDIWKKPPDDPDKMGALTHSKQWNRKTHGAADSRTCPACHEAGVCRECHGIDFPHDRDTWTIEHSEIARKDPQVCRTCHKKSYCEDCHQTPMPHAPDFTAKHIGGGGVGTAVCLNCHLRSECIDCHETHEARKKAGSRP